MQGISDALRAQTLLQAHDFHFSRALGQNFLLNDRINEQIVALAGCDGAGCVLEIGPGAGTLTCAIARTGARVTAVEIDTALEEILREMLAPYPNAQILFGDICKKDIARLADESFGEGVPYSVIANLPYAIAANLLPKLVSAHRAPESVTVMVQQEAADRICSAPGEKTWCAMSARMQYFSEVSVAMMLPPDAFTPNAHVYSALLTARVYTKEERPAQPKSEEHFLRVLDAAFAMRRKTMANNLTRALGITREEALGALVQAGLSETVRGETLTLAQLAAISDALLQDPA